MSYGLGMDEDRLATEMLEMAKEGRHRVKAWQGSSPQITRPDVMVAQAERFVAIIAALTERGMMTVNTLADVLGHSDYTIQRSLRALCFDGKVEKVRLGHFRFGYRIGKGPKE